MYDDKYTKTEIKIDNNPNFQGNKIPESNDYCTCSSVMLLLDSFVGIENDYYPQMQKCSGKEKDNEYN